MSQESSTDADAAPLQPRDQYAQQTLDEAGQPGAYGRLERDDIVDMPHAHPDLMFNAFLIELAEEINEDELENMKLLLKGQIGRRVLDQLTSAKKVFDEFRKNCFISRNNLLYLQCILMHLKRKDLVQMAVKYSEKAGNALYFEPPPDAPQNGYTSIKFHVKGGDFQSWSAAKINDLRTKLSSLLFVPPQDVIVAGIQPSRSLLITVFLPEMYAEILESMLEANDPMQPLIDMSIDTVDVGCKTYNIGGAEGVKIVDTVQHLQLVNVYQQLQDKTVQLEAMSEETLLLEKRVNELDMEIVTLRGMFRKPNDQPASLVIQSSYKLFKQCLQKVKDQGYDTTLIRNLLSTNVTVVANIIREESASRVRELQLALSNAQSYVIPLQHQLDIVHLTETGSMQQIWQMLGESLAKLRQPAEVSVQTTLTASGFEILRTFSSLLVPGERQKLEKRYTWDPCDPLTLYKEQDTSYLLECILAKEIAHTKGQVTFESFVEKCLKEINRSDLLQKFHGILSEQRRMHQQRSSSQQGKQSETTSSSHVDKHQSRMEEKIDMLVEMVKAIGDQIQSVKTSDKAAEGFDRLFQSYSSSKLSGMFESLSKPTEGPENSKDS